MSKIEEAKRKLGLALSSTREVDRESAIHQALAALNSIAANKAAEEGGLPALDEDTAEGMQLIDTLMDNIAEGGNYSAEATLTFLSQIRQCFAADRASRQVANKAAEEGGLTQLRTSITSMPMRTFQGCVYVHLDSVLADICQLEIIAADRASRQVANKAEVEPTCVCGSPATLGSVHRTDGPCYVAEATIPANKAEVDRSDDEIFNFWLYRDCMPAIQAGDMKGQFVSAVRALLATPPATTGASTVLTDERIERSIDTQDFQTFNNDRLGLDVTGNVYKELVAYIDQHVAHEVAAQAGQVAVPDDEARDAARYRWIVSGKSIPMARPSGARAPKVRTLHKANKPGDTLMQFYAWDDKSAIDKGIDTAMNSAPSPAKESK